MLPETPFTVMVSVSPSRAGMTAALVSVQPSSRSFSRIVRLLAVARRVGYSLGFD